MDEQVQAARRRWLASGDPDDERRYLQARARAGSPVPRGCLEVAAYAGDPVAREELLAEGVHLEGPVAAGPWVSTLARLERFTVAVGVQAALGGLRHLLPALDGALERELAGRALDLATDARGAEREAALALVLRFEHERPTCYAPLTVQQRLLSAYYRLARALVTKPEHHAGVALRTGLAAAEDTHGYRAAIAAALVPWVLTLERGPAPLVVAEGHAGHADVLRLGEALPGPTARRLATDDLAPLAVLDEYLEALGWRRGRAGEWLHPARRQRLELEHERLVTRLAVAGSWRPVHCWSLTWRDSVQLFASDVVAEARRQASAPGPR